jgi:lysophospholipid acyltransferase (LPLAT)-like uncharacterized protein
MKIRNRKVIRILGLLASWLVRGWVGTVRFRQRTLGPEVNPFTPGLAGRYIYLFWHEFMLVPAYHFRRPDIHVLISQHADGQLIAEACRHLGFHLVRGSTNRGGSEALRQLLRLSRSSHLAITPDGPRGPRRQVQPGVIYLAARTGLPIVPFGAGVRAAWRAKSWDRFAVPRPFTLATCVWGEPIFVPREAARERQEEYRLLVQQAMDRATSLAEIWAQTGTYPKAAGEAGGPGRLPGAA